MVTIYLRDINDHRPTFPQSLYNLNVSEHSEAGYVVTDSIHVSDGGRDQGRAQLGGTQRWAGLGPWPCWGLCYTLMSSSLSQCVRARDCAWVWCPCAKSECVGASPFVSESRAALSSSVAPLTRSAWLLNSVLLFLSLPHRPLIRTRGRGAASPTACFQGMGKVLGGWGLGGRGACGRAAQPACLPHSGAGVAR